MALVSDEIETVEINNLESKGHDDLLALINDLDEERKQLRGSAEEAEEETCSLREKVDALESRLLEAADLMAEQGRIHNTPHAKRHWIDGR